MKVLNNDPNRVAEAFLLGHLACNRYLNIQQAKALVVIYRNETCSGYDWRRSIVKSRFQSETLWHESQGELFALRQ